MVCGIRRREECHRSFATGEGYDFSVRHGWEDHCRGYYAIAETCFPGHGDDRRLPAEVQYAGSAPGAVSGALQVNVVVPDDAPSGSAVPVVLTVGGIDSPAATMAIQ